MAELKRENSVSNRASGRDQNRHSIYVYERPSVFHLVQVQLMISYRIECIR